MSENKKILYTSHKERPSPFLVNLNKFITNEEKKENLKNKSFLSRFFSFFLFFKPKKEEEPQFFFHENSEFEKPKKFNIFNFKKIPPATKFSLLNNENKKQTFLNRLNLQIKTIFQKNKDILPHFSWSKEKIFNKNGLEDKKNYKKIRRLSFFAPVKLIFDLSFKIGYIFVFVARFFGVLNIALLKFVVSFFDFRVETTSPCPNSPLERTNFSSIKTPALIKDKIEGVGGEIKKNNLLKKILGINPESALLKNREFISRLIKNRGIYTHRRPSILKSLLVFVFILMILISPFGAIDYYQNLDALRGRVLGASESAINDILIASRSMADLNFAHANQGFVQAGNSFFEAQKEIEKISGLLSILHTLPNQKLKLASMADSILRGGEIASEIGNQFTSALSIFEKKEELSIKDIIDSFYTHGKIISKNIQELKIIISQINLRDIPQEYLETFIILKEKLKLVDSGLVEFIDILEKLKIFLGFEIDKRYMLVFQNNTEMRASGGFMGSFAVIDFADGQITNLDVPGGGTYDTEADVVL